MANDIDISKVQWDSPTKIDSSKVQWDKQPDSKQPDSVATQGASFLTQHPFKSVLQGLPETLTGKTMEQRAVEDVNKPSFMQSETAPFDKFLPRARQAAENEIVGGQIIDQVSSPSNYLAAPIKGLSKVVGLTKAINTLGKPAVSHLMSIFSGIPQKDVLKAVENPNILSKPWLDKEGEVVKDLYQNKIIPAVENIKNRVNTLGIGKTLQDSIKLETSGEATRTASTMSNIEKNKIVTWLNQIKNGDISLNKLDAMIGEMDKGLGKVYGKMEKMKLEPISSTFESITNKMRGALKGARDEQYKNLAPIWNRYTDYKNAQRIAQSFDSWHPKLMNVAKTSALLGITGVHNPEIFGAAAMGAIPKVQGLGIELGGALSKVPSFVPAQAAISKEKENNQ